MIMSGMLLLFLALVAHTNGKNIVCYYLNLSQYTPAPYGFTADKIDGRLCTHVIFAFLAPKGVDVETKEWNDEEMFNRLMGVREKNPNMRMLLSVGGPSVGRRPFLSLASRDNLRAKFAQNVITFVRKHRFDGFDLAWQYPEATDKANYAALVEALSLAFVTEARSTGKPRLVLSASLPAKRAIINAGLDIPKLAGSLDMFNILTVDFAEISEPLTVLNAPLYAHPNDTESAAILNIDWVARYYVARGAPKNKMNIGISSYGRSYTLKDPKKSSLKSQVASPGKWNKYSGLIGRMSYHEICTFIKGGGNVTRVMSQGNPYVVKGNQWVGYDDPMSVTQKARYISYNGYGGALFWTLDLDDFLGKSCGDQKYPLLKAINDAFPDETIPVPPIIVLPNVTSQPPKKETIQGNGDYKYNILCYYTNEAQNRPGKGRFGPEHVDPKLCTHITFAFCKIVGMNLAPYKTNDVEMFRKINALKAKNPKLRTILAVGGANMGVYPFVAVSKIRSSRETFAKNVISFVRKHNFDGFDVFWKFPGSVEKNRFTLMIQTLRESFDAEAKSSGKPRLQLVVATSAEKSIIHAGLEVAEVAKYVDFLNVLTYDYFGYSWSSVTGFNSALYAHPDQSINDKYLNVNWSAKYIESLGAPKEKINIAIATYGRSFTLRNPGYHSVMSQHNGAGSVMQYSGKPGLAFYYEICEFIHSGGIVVHVESQGNPYVVRGNQWIGYDDVESVTKKAEYVRQNKYAGVIVWALDNDDFVGTFCNQGKFPLLKAISKKFSNSEPPPVQPIIEISKVTSPPKKTIEDDYYDHNILCLYTNDAQKRPGMGQFFPKDVDPRLCTHITFAYCKIVGLNIASNAATDVQSYLEINALKTVYPKLKTLLAVGGPSTGAFRFVEVSKNQRSRETFAQNVIKYVRQHNFDGLDVVWKFPGAFEKNRFNLLIQKLRESFDAEANSTGKPRLQLAIAVSAEKLMIDAGFDFAELGKYVDFLNVLTIDYFGYSWSKSIGFNSALYAHPDQKVGDKNLNVHWSAKYIESLGAPKEKINIAIATYGRSFTLKDPQLHSVMSPFNGGGSALSYSGKLGIAFYYEICQQIKSGGKVERVESQGNPYVVRGNQWIGYDDVESVTKKAQYVKDNNYGGVMVVALDNDDFTGTFCSQGKYPLLSAISQTFTSRQASTFASEADETSVAVGAHNAISATWILTLLVALLA